MTADTAPAASTVETVIAVRRVMSGDDATKLIGTPVGADLDATFKSPRDGRYVRLIDEADGATVALVTRLPAATRSELRNLLTTRKYSEGVARQGRKMPVTGLTFGYAPRKVIARQEGCRMTAFGRDDPTAEQFLERMAADFTDEFTRLVPEQAEHDLATLSSSVLNEWRMSGSSLWTSGVINKSNVLPYHRDGNNLETWSVMPTIRYGVNGGRLHLPEYGVVFPCGDGDVTWFYGRGLVHGVTPMEARKPDGYRFSLVLYALKGMVNCADYAAETVKAATRRSDRERSEAAAIRSAAGLPPPSSVALAEADDLPDGQPITLADSFPEEDADSPALPAPGSRFDDYRTWHHLQVESHDLDPVYPVLRHLADRWHLTISQRAWLVVLHVTYYHLGSALTAFRRWPTVADVDPADDTMLRLPTGTERRAHRDTRQLAKHLTAWTALGADPWEWLTAEGPAWEPLNRRITTLYGNGRWAAYKTAEMLQKVCGLDTIATDAGHRYSSGPRHGLELLYDNLPTGQTDPDIAALDAVTADLAARIGEPDIAQVETSLCDYHSLAKGRYYLGADIDGMQEQLRSPRVQPGTDVWEARAAVFQPRFLGELNGWLGVRKELRRRYLDTGALDW